MRRLPNLIEEAVANAPDQAYSVDITNLQPPQSFCYLASIIDEISHFCVGRPWKMNRLSPDGIIGMDR